MFVLMCFCLLVFIIIVLQYTLYYEMFKTIDKRSYPSLVMFNVGLHACA